MSANKMASFGRITAMVFRILLGLTFLLSGSVKAIDPLGTTYKIEDYLHAFGGFFVQLDVLAFPLAIALFTFEFVLGICLLLNVKTKLTAWLALLMMLFMTPLTLYIALENPVSDCGCFGDAIVLGNWTTFYKNVALLIMAIVLVCWRNQVRPTFKPGAEIGVALCALLLIISLSTYCLLTLPIVDFRPYKVNTDIVQSMEVPDDAEPDVYETSFIYAKNGIEKAFTLENYPKNDSTWTFVDQRTTLVKKGYEPPIHDFSIVNADFEDITYDILADEGKTVLVIMYDLAKTNRKQAAKLNILYDQAQSEGAAFYALTGSGSQEVADFVRETNARYPFCTTDPVTLKTIVRANPGVLVLKNGCVVEKHNVRQL